MTTQRRLQTRRATRTTRTTTAKDNENANARPSRITTRAKPSSLVANTTATATGASRATAGTAASRAKMNVNGDSKADATAGKRKREALGEVTGPVTNNKSTVGGKGKDKEDLKKEKHEGVVLRAKTTVVRQPLRTVASTRQAAKATVLDEVKEEVVKASDDNAMVVDPPVPAPALPSITVRRSLIAKENTAAAVRRSDVHRRTSARSIATAQQAAEDLEADRVFKKRRTSSEAPEDPEAIAEARLRAEEEEAAAKIAAELDAYAEEPEADPEDSPWDDLDADDNDDPLMVSEYVGEIFKYLKQIEVSLGYLPSSRNTNP